jgi:hypothetical protein
VALIAGAVFETAQLALPRLVRRSRLYEATAKNLLRIAIELVGAVEAAPSASQTAPVDAATPPKGRTISAGAELTSGELAKRKAAGNVVELGSIAAFGFSPLWLLAAASDIARGSRVYLNALVEELKRAELLGEEVEVGSVDELLAALESSSGRTARLIDIPPLELAELRATLAELRADADQLPSQSELAALFRALRRTAERENRPLLEVSQGVGLAFLLSAREVSRRHLVVPYREDWQPLRREGFAAYARRVSGPYRDAVGRHFDPAAPTWTERLIGRVAKDV